MSRFVFIGGQTDLIKIMIKSKNINTIDLKRYEFPNNNILHQISPESVKDDINILVDVSFKMHESIWELICILDLFDNINLHVNNLILPYFPYSRSNKESVNFSSGLFSLIKLFNNYKINNIITIDPHFGSQHLFLKSKLNVISFNTIFENELRLLIDSKTLIIGPDKGSIKRITEIADHYKVSGFHLNKSRVTHDEIVEVTVMDKFKELLKGCSNIIVVDDEICSGQTILKTIELLKSIRQDIIIDIIATHCFIPERNITFLPLIHSLTTTNTITNNYEDQKINIVNITSKILSYIV